MSEENQINITMGLSDADRELLGSLRDALVNAAACMPDATTKTAPTAAEKKAMKALNVAAAKQAAEAEADTAEAETDAGTDDSGLSREDVRMALKEYAALEGKPAAIQILKDAGANSVGELAEDKFADVVAACSS